MIDDEELFNPGRASADRDWAAALDSPVIDDEYEKALYVLRNCSHEAGLKASAGQIGHHQVWARDSMISLLGASLTKDGRVSAALSASIATLRRHQALNGCIPNHVDVGTGAPNFRAYADGGLWYVIGSSILDPDLKTMRRVLRWYECQDVDQSGLLSMQESSDWQDLFCTRGKALTLNCLYVIALKKMAEVEEARGHLRRADFCRLRAVGVSNAINRLLWHPGDGETLRHITHSFSTPNVQHDSLGRKRWFPPKRLLAGESYYLPYLSFRQIGEWFDSLGNLLAILSGVASPIQADTILEFVRRYGLAEQPICAIYPPVQPGDQDWRDYYGSLNTPNRYHNGGIWPFIGGFYIGALVKCGRMNEAVSSLHSLARLNRQGEFNEWHHGETGEPLGVCGQGWSAGMYVYARYCVLRGSAIYF